MTPSDPDAPDAVSHAARVGVPEASDAMSLASRVWQAGSLLTAYITARVEVGDLQLGEAEVLMATRVRGELGTTPADLRAQLNLTSPGITKRIDSVEARGLVTRQPHPTDRRSVTLHLTPAGIELADETIRVVASAMSELLGADTDLSVEALNAELDTLIGALRRHGS